MDIDTYFVQRFPEHLRQLPFIRPNAVIREVVFEGSDTFFFGGCDWETASRDLALIPPADRFRFVLSLFMIVLTDQCLYTHHQDCYETWRRLTSFPKFGWAGFNAHHENPFKILYAAEREMAIDIDAAVHFMPAFAEYLVRRTEDFLFRHLPSVKPSNYFREITTDNAYAFDQGRLVPSFKQAFEEVLAATPE